MGQKVFVAGCQKSGISAAKLLLSMGGEVLLYDGNQALDIEELRRDFKASDAVQFICGELTKKDLKGVELCIISPGIPLTAPFVFLLLELKIPIWGEIQLAYHCARGRLVAITGTNGKTTTTALTGEILESYFSQVFVVGNIGIPYTQIALETTERSVTVAEVSSFQLETIMDFRPEVSAILNITPDHLDRHQTMECYIDTKMGITKNQRESDTCVLNYDDFVLREFGQQLNMNVVFFSSKEVLKEGIYLNGKTIMYRHNEVETSVIHVDETNLLGNHNYENMMAAIAIALNIGVPMECIRGVLKTFQAVEHRIEFVLERFGVKYYNDSKGTNPDAAIQAIKAMTGQVVLIAGGYDKDGEYDAWVESFLGKVKHLVLIGQTRDKIAECAKKHGFHEIMYAEDMEEAVSVSAAYAAPGECVLLSPACASWGMFKNYEERGDMFKQCVRSL